MFFYSRKRLEIRNRKTKGTGISPDAFWDLTLAPSLAFALFWIWHPFQERRRLDIASSSGLMAVCV